jgi:hypothetical protein
LQGVRLGDTERVEPERRGLLGVRLGDTERVQPERRGLLGERLGDTERNQIRRKSMNTVKIIEHMYGIDGKVIRETTQQAEDHGVRVRVNFKVSTANIFQANITSESDSVETSMANMVKAHRELEAFRIANGYSKPEVKA